jgi:hypothetical protein
MTFRTGNHSAPASPLPRRRGRRLTAAKRLPHDGSAAPQLVTMVTQTEARRGRADASAGRPPWPESNPPCEEEEEKKGLQRWFSGVVAVVAVGRRWLAGGDRRSPETADRMVAVRVKP